MRKTILSLFLTLWTSVASAGVSCSLPFNLQNGTTADATQVMANYNALVTCLSNAAAAGANTDITALLGLVTPLAPGSGGTQVYYGGVAGGAANAITLTTTPTVFGLTAGNKVRFVVTTTNTAATTLNTSASGVKAVLRPTPAGLVALSGGELVATTVAEAMYDGTQYQLLPTATSAIPPGVIMDYVGVAAPAGWALAQGQCVSQTTFAALFTLASTSWGSCGAGLFALPDLRGRLTAMVDGGANRITNAGSGCTATLATGCGTQNQTITTGNVPALTVTVTDPGHIHVLTQGSTSTGGGSTFVLGATSAIGGINTTSVTTGITAAANVGSANTALTVLNPTLIVNKIIKF